MSNAKGNVCNLIDQKLIQIHIERKVRYFVVTKRIYKLLSSIKEKGTINIDFTYDDAEVEILGKKAQRITKFHEITLKEDGIKKIIYSHQQENKEIVDEITAPHYKMFLDMEMTMPEYGKFIKDFICEIIQVGLVICDENDEVVHSYDKFIKSKKKVSNRCLDFLHLEKKDFKGAISFKKFYSDFERLLEVFKPTIYVWGSNDMFSLKEGYKLHHLKPLKTTHIDLMNEIKKYYELPHEMSLFDTLKVFKDVSAYQAHYALTDAWATKDIFDSFKNAIINNTNIDFDLHKKKETLS